MIDDLTRLNSIGGNDKIGRYQSFIKFNFSKVNSKLKIGLAIITLLFCILAIYFFIILNISEEKIDLSEQTKFTWKNSIAVLPFDDLSPAKDQEYFCDGMADEISVKLTKINDLKVIARTSVLKYKQNKTDVIKIGQELGVATVLEGSVRKEGNSVKIIVKLINANNRFSMWNESYIGGLEGVFEIQEDVSMDIAEALKVQFNPETLSSQKSEQPTSMDAYEYYLKTIYFTKRFTISRFKEEFDNALLMAHKALEVDSTYALTYAILAWVHENHFTIRKNQRG